MPRNRARRADDAKQRKQKNINSDIDHILDYENSPHIKGFWYAIKCRTTLSCKYEVQNVHLDRSRDCTVAVDSSNEQVTTQLEGGI